MKKERVRRKIIKNESILEATAIENTTNAAKTPRLAAQEKMTLRKDIKLIKSKWVFSYIIISVKTSRKVSKSDISFSIEF